MDNEGHDRSLQKQPHLCYSLCCPNPWRPAGAWAAWSITEPWSKLSWKVSIRITESSFWSYTGHPKNATLSLISFHKEGTRKGLGFFGSFFLKFHCELLVLDTRNLARHTHGNPAISSTSSHIWGRSDSTSAEDFSRWSSQSLAMLTLLRVGKSSAVASKLSWQCISVPGEVVGEWWKNPSAFLGLHLLETDTQWQEKPSCWNTPACCQLSSLRSLDKAQKAVWCLPVAACDLSRQQLRAAGRQESPHPSPAQLQQHLGFVSRGSSWVQRRRWEVRCGGSCAVIKAGWRGGGLQTAEQ